MVHYVQHLKERTLMIYVKKYNPSDKGLWDEFVSHSKNGTFLFFRDYMDYHSHRFNDHSLIIQDSRKKRTLALFPANEKGRRITSHGGLTYGGVISGDRMKTSLMLEIFNAIIDHFARLGMEDILYKAIPHIYHRYPSEEDLYALFINKASLVRRDVSSTIDLSSTRGLSKKRRTQIRSALRTGLRVTEQGDLAVFMELLAHVLMERHGVLPVHTYREMNCLMMRFPGQIRLVCCYLGDEMIGGVIVYLTDTVAHLQYIAINEKGRRYFALDMMIHHLMEVFSKDRKYLDFGISTEKEGMFLNRGLIWNKESFGATATVHDFYRLDLGSCH
ncbi:MAG: GNAT family N-acetyltransferase [Synergistales bacterium]|nr:GNAT family N-acetyltransferase [Synergistales bacterium]